MGQAVPTQHAAAAPVVIPPRHNLMRVLLAFAAIAIVGLTVAVVILATDDERSTGTSSRAADGFVGSPGGNRDYSGTAPTRKLDGSADIPNTPPVAPGTRYDGGPEEGTRGLRQPDATAPDYVNPSTGFPSPGNDGS